MKSYTQDQAWDGSWEDQEQVLTLSLPQEFSFSQNLDYLAGAPNECLFHLKNGRIYRAIPAGEELSIVEISDAGKNAMAVRFLGDTAPKSKEGRAAVARYVHDWFDLGTDLRPFYELAKTDALLQRAVDSFYGLRNVGIPDLFEAISWGIIGQQINMSFAYTLKRRMVESFGTPVTCEGEVYWLFPDPERIAALRPEELQELKMTAKKSEYLIDVARLIVEGKLSKEQLLSAGTGRAAEKQLVQIRGIGPWTANYVLMRCLRIPSAFPIDDVGLHNAIKYLLGTDEKPTKEELIRLSTGWTNWESYATFYLWRFLY
ncbi:DNA-3-methyladenine glycosylase family protein [Brevibacillus reuszeri]|uniref:DNA-3-methyladenine glycosylase family protein n=1 Tax=Brevibacillus reuszeri TaxID=54915 RepID=UPI00289E3907|nr:DNA-3-methyladenine glycosylase [Brevibacillus reuszeri]